MVLKKFIETLKQDIKSLKAITRKDIDKYFSEAILPQLSNLYRDGRLPNMGQDHLWLKVEEEWNKASEDSKVACDVDLVKRLMDQFIQRGKDGEVVDG